MNKELSLPNLNLDPKISQKAKPKRSKLTKKIANWGVFILICGFLIFLNFYFKNLYIELYEITRRVIEDRSFMTYFNIFLINILLQMCFVPGISFFIMYIGFICKDYFYALSLIIPSTLAVCAITYLITRFTIKDCLRGKLSGKWYFKMFYEESAIKPWRTSFMLRFILIPVTYKNYLISLMDIDFVQFMVPAVAFYLPYFSNYILIGMTVSSINDIMEGKISQAELKVLIAFTCLYVFLILLSIASLGFLIYKTCQLRKQYEDAEKQEILMSNESETN